MDKTIAELSGCGMPYHKQTDCIAISNGFLSAYNAYGFTPYGFVALPENYKLADIMRDGDSSAIYGESEAGGMELA